MANTLELQTVFNNGMKQDEPREQMQKGASWNMSNLIPESGAPLRKRGGWNRPFNAFGTGGTYGAGVGFASFSTGSQVVGYDNSGNLVAFTPGSATATARGTVSVGAAQPIFYRERLYFPDLAGTSALKYYDGANNAANVSGSPPAGAVGCIYKDHLVLARSNANKNRVWFSDGGDPTGWDTAADGQWLDTTYVIQGLAATSNLILVFGEGFTERIRGDIIPGVSGSDFVKEPLWPIGCSDPGSIALWDGLVIFANSTGVYASDGSTVVIDLTQQGGIKHLWLSTLASYDSDYTLAAAVFRNRYHITIMDGSTFIDSFVCDLPHRTWWRNTNVETIMMAATPVGLFDVSPTLYMAERGALRVADLGTMYTPSATYKNDGDGDAVTWTLETPHYKAKSGLKRWRHLHTSCDIRDAATDNPVLTAAYAVDPAATSYTSLSPTIPEGTAYKRVRVPIGGKKAEGMQFRLTQTDASSDTRIYGLEAELHQLEQSRRS